MKFNFRAKNKEGEPVQGTIEAPNEELAISILQQRGVIIFYLEPSEKPIFSKDVESFLNRPSRKDTIAFTRQLATLIESDVPLLEGLNTLAKQTSKDSFRRVINNIAAAVEGGASLSVALSEHSSIFNGFYISLVRVGEVSGRLEQTLQYLADYLEHSAALTSKIKGALYYPTFVLVALVLVTTIMMTTVIPQLLSVVTESGVTELPLATRILLFVTSVFNDYFLFFLGILVAVIVVFYTRIRTPEGHYRWDRFKINIPQFGKIMRNLYLSRMAETLSTLVKAGVPILEGIEITSDVVGNDVYKGILLEAKENVQAGGSISETFMTKEEIPNLVSSMLQTGEKTGRTSTMLDNISKFYKTEAENSLQNISQLIEPILILLLGLGIGILIAAILLPIYGLVGA